jgi:hypothetical protein
MLQLDVQVFLAAPSWQAFPSCSWISNIPCWPYQSSIPGLLLCSNLTSCDYLARIPKLCCWSSIIPCCPYLTSIPKQFLEFNYSFLSQLVKLFHPDSAQALPATPTYLINSTLLCSILTSYSYLSNQFNLTLFKPYQLLLPVWPFQPDSPQSLPAAPTWLILPTWLC